MADDRLNEAIGIVAQQVAAQCTAAIDTHRPEDLHDDTDWVAIKQRVSQVIAPYPDPVSYRAAMDYLNSVHPEEPEEEG